VPRRRRCAAEGFGCGVRVSTGRAKSLGKLKPSRLPLRPSAGLASSGLDPAQRRRGRKCWPSPSSSGPKSAGRCGGPASQTFKLALQVCNNPWPVAFADRLFAISGPQLGAFGVPATSDSCSDSTARADAGGRSRAAGWGCSDSAGLQFGCATAHWAPSVGDRIVRRVAFDAERPHLVRRQVEPPDRRERDAHGPPKSA